MGRLDGRPVRRVAALLVVIAASLSVASIVHLADHVQAAPTSTTTATIAKAIAAVLAGGATLS